MTLKHILKTAVVIIPGLLLFSIAAACEAIADLAGNAASVLGKWADR